MCQGGSEIVYKWNCVESRAYLLKRCYRLPPTRFQGDPIKVPLENPSFADCGDN